MTNLIQKKIHSDPVLKLLAKEEPCWWFNKALDDVYLSLEQTGIDANLVAKARERFIRFAPWFMQNYPASVKTGGILESDLQHAGRSVEILNNKLATQLLGNLWFKRDDLLPVSGSIKARGGIHEVLEIAETVALKAGVLGVTDDYPRFSDLSIKKVLNNYGIAVGSTGNLVLSIGLIAARLGFATTVHMSHDAKVWKKEMLRSQGVIVEEHTGNFSEAVAAGRFAAAKTPNTFFIDDEESLSLFAGYAVAAKRLAGQLQSLEISVSEDHPLFVYLPCGVGGSPGGITYGLKQTFGPHVHCIFVEPTASPALSLGVRTGLHNKISVTDIGLDGKTLADGLAVGRSSRLIGQTLGHIVDGYVTLSDEQILAQVALLAASEGIEIEPSATAGVAVPWIVENDNEFLESRNIDPANLKNVNHIAWFTGGSMVPQAEMNADIISGKKLLPKTAFFTSLITQKFKEELDHD